MWRLVAPAFHADYRVILFDLAGSGRADPSAYDRTRHATIGGYAQDVVNICSELDLREVIFVGHSVSAMIGVLAALARPDLFAKLVLIGPSPRYINDGDYVGGFSAQDIDSLIDTLDSNYLGWAAAMAPVIMDNPDRPQLGEELKNSFCRTQPDVARAFARVTFLSDNRADLSRVRTPSLIVQCTSDVIAPMAVGEYVNRHLPGSQMAVLDARGHCPHLSAPEQTIAAMRQFLQAC
jgi:sigma-B regulation protein RsbQ